MKRIMLIAILICTGAINSGCVELLAAGTLSGINEIYKYSSNNVANKTFTADIQDVEKATEKALEKMDMKMEKKEKRDDGVIVSAATSKLKIMIDVESLTASTTRVSVNARVNAFQKDKATAEEIVSQIDTFVSENAVRKQKEGLAEDAKKVYLVRRGDCPYVIAKQHQIPLNELLTLNNLTTRSTIFPGQELQIR